MKTNEPSRSFLVTGGAGFIGSNLVLMLVGAGHRVLNIDKLTYAGNLDSLSGIQGHPNYEFIRADIADDAAMKEAMTRFKPDVIFHLAAESHVDRSIDEPLEFVRTNVLGTATLLHAAHGYWSGLDNTGKADFRFMHVSTDEVFGSLGKTGYFNENTPYKPNSPYSASKASSDHLARAWAITYGLPVIVTNCSNNYGPFQYPEKLIPMVITRALRGETIPVFGKGENVRDWVYVEDHCKALMAAYERGRPGEKYVIGGENQLKNIDLVRLLCNLLDVLSPRRDGVSYEKQISFVTDRPGHDFRYAMDITKIRKELDWQPLTNAGEYLRATVIWYVENKVWIKSILDRSLRLE